MDKKNQIRIALTVAIIFSIFLYHTMNYISPQGTNEFTLFKIAQFAINIAFTCIFIYNKYLIRILFKEIYVAGRYEGYSKHYEEDDSKEEKEPDSQYRGIEKFTIKQNLFETVIIGKSFQEINGKSNLVSTWLGRLFKSEENTFYFAIELSTSKGEFGIMKLTYEDNEIHGFYYSGDPKITHAYTISAKRVSG